MSTLQYTYRLFGLNVASEFDLPEAQAGDIGATPDVVVRWGDVPESDLERQIAARRYALPGPHWIVRDRVSNVALRISSGTDITVSCRRDHESGASDARLYTIGSGLGAILVQRGLLPFHANAVAGPSGAILLCGHVGAGKSTTTLELIRSGYRLVADDVCALDLSLDGVMVIPGPPRLKLWADTFDAREGDGHQRIRPGVDKFYVPFPSHEQSVPLDAIFVIRSEAEVPSVAVRRLAGAELVLQLTPHIYKTTLPEMSEHWPESVERFGRAARTARVWQIVRPRGRDTRATVARLITEHLAS